MTQLPHMSDRPFLTDAGLETWLLFQRGFDLPFFASFALLRDTAGRAAMTEYFSGFLDLAASRNTGFVLDTCTWRANPDWAARLGHDVTALAEINADAVRYAMELRVQSGIGDAVLVNGVVGPRGDGYDPAELMSVIEARAYHQFQVDALARGGVDLVSAITMTNTAEAIGIADAAAQAAVPCVVSFTVETDGCLPTGQPLADAIAETDDESACAPAYYMINCAHPDHFRNRLTEGRWRDRIYGLRANASRMSHAELDACETLDDGDPQELGALYADLKAHLPRLAVFGGCCGTDLRHVSSICEAVHAS
ncbi:homocysteine S-methyltransferase family protein [Roseobacter sinensis]|uniref:Homocysteine S-methyltransferase family protein n=1 Tax=Roseobacter sinensis TaxID=2931391 RepID=A0ABT3BEN9_9RHOB|nr:homocysteine S-methyltransferase family protein [Roseobacter sp. WL0113]MCV3272043.1 homocysteine S-methyltransferase family protein [Roseobacter sp. WL0113]